MQSYRGRKPAGKSAALKPEERVYFDTKYGPVAVHQNGSFAKELSVSPSKTDEEYSIENVRISLHLERFEALIPFTEELECVARFPASEYTVRHPLLCQMRIGQTHGAAAFQTSYIAVAMQAASDSVVEIEFVQAEKSLWKMTLPLRLATTA